MFSKLHQNWPRLFIILSLMIYGSYFLSRGLSAGLTHDDLMNTYRAWAASWGNITLDNIFYFRPTLLFRPFPGFILKGWFENFSFDVYPLRIICLATLAANALLAGLIARKITGSDWAGGLAALIYTFHLQWAALYLSSGFIYDAFCSFFYLAAFYFYLRGGWKNRTVTALLYICALNSKEIGVGLPATIFLYELFLTKPAWHPQKFIWSIVYGVMTLPYILGRVLSNQGVSSYEGYKVDPSLGVYFTQFGRYLRIWTNTEIELPGALIFILPSLLLIAAYFLKKIRIVGWGLASFAIGILPVALIHPRNLDSVYIPLVTLSIAIAAVVMKLTARSNLASAGLFVFCLLVLTRANDAPLPTDRYIKEDQLIVEVKAATERMYQKIPANSILMIERDVFRDDYWSTFFLAAMTQGKKDIPAFAVNKVPLKDQEKLRSSANYIVNWNGTDWELTPQN